MYLQAKIFLTLHS